MMLLLRLILLLLIVRAVLIFVRGAISGAKGEPKIGPAGVQLMRDPVCGVYVSPATALTLRSGSGTAYFCSEKCREAWRDS
jgi:YHS domain-containing protein